MLAIITSCGGGGGGGAVSFQGSGAKYHNGGGNSGFGIGNQTGGGFGSGSSFSSGSDELLFESFPSFFSPIDHMDISLNINGTSSEFTGLDTNAKKDVLGLRNGDKVSGTLYIYLEGEESPRVAVLDETEITLTTSLKFKVPYKYRAYDLVNNLLTSGEYFSSDGINLETETQGSIAGWRCDQDGSIHYGGHVSGVRGDIDLFAVDAAGAITIPTPALAITDTPSSATLNNTVYLLSSLGDFKVKVNPESGSFPSGVKYEWQISVISRGTVPDTILSALENSQEITIDSSMLAAMGINNISDIATNPSSPDSIVVKCKVKHDSLPSSEWKDCTALLIKICKAPVITAAASAGSIDVDDSTEYPLTITVTGATGTPLIPVLNPASASSLLAIDTPTQVDAATGTYNIDIGIGSGTAENLGKVWFDDDTVVTVQIPDPSGVMAAPTITITLVNKYICKLKNSNGTNVGSLPTYNIDGQLSFSTATASVGTDPSGRDIAAFRDTADNRVYKESDFPITFNSNNFSKRVITLQAIPEFEFIPTGGDGDGSTHAGTAADPYAIKKDVPSSNVNAYVWPGTNYGDIEITVDPPFSTHGLLKIGTGSSLIQWEDNPDPAAIAAMPAGGITYEVTVTDTGSGFAKTIYVTAMKPIIGTKSAPDSLYDIVFKDGSAMSRTEFSSLDVDTKNAKAADAIAVIFDAANKLGISLREDSGSAWAPSGSTGNSYCFSTTDTDGSLNWAQITSMDAAHTGSNAGMYYAAFYYCNNYSASGVGGWYLPAKEELRTLNTNKATVNNTLASILGAATISGDYWSSSQYSPGGDTQAWGYDANLNNIAGFPKENIRKVRAVKKFN